ncbi:hypothetical protein GA0115240_10647 [Streptomyces sp. DvalAA-14]|uniref:hypothetical protein n=1 Tax=unclassified Streptomyces TaxID=2593676 RepID=UPI00081B9826|nr:MULTISPECIES: hypothetical protein [unclassified Streptomyces]MYS19213.1 hypothetical protein [Streptomyces sp. SID4948]SCD39332.1 hypothetical protein GA0115240_10647 [Streptomyces sp. DvalAA-14]
MFLHMPLVIALAVIAFFLHRKGAIKPTHSLACGAFGFYLADTGFAGSIHAASADLLGMIGQFAL